jgi:competence protein ComEC
VAIGLALVPLTAAFFGEVPLFGPLVNLAAIPLFNFVLVPLTLLATVLAAWPVPFGLEPVVHVAGLAASETVRALHAVAALPGAAVAIGSVSPLAAALATLGVAFAMPAHPLPGRRLAWLAIVPALWPAASLPATGEARIVVLDVGHGLAVSVATRTHRLLFDAGPSFPSGFDVGEEVVLPALAADGRRTLDLLIVSHADNDHAGGAGAVVAAFPRAAVLHGPDVTTLPGRVCARGQRWTWDSVGFAILHPPVDVAARGNDSSCVLRIEAGGAAALLTGDVEAHGEAALLAAAQRDAAPFAADVVVVPHHGSATSSTPAFVAAAHARQAIVSAGYRNRWGFPRAMVSERWRKSGAPITVTGDSGAVAIDLGPAGVQVRTERDARHHYWEAHGDPVVQP